MKRLCAILLLLSVLLCACGYDAYDPALFGYYRGTSIDAEGYEIDMTSVYAGENYIELAGEGKGCISLAGHVYEIEWGLRGEHLTLTLQGEDSEGSLQNGVILLNYLDMGMELRFEYDADYAPAPAKTKTEAQLWWNGDWYGWWVIANGSGSFAELSGSWWDLCARIDFDEQGKGSMMLWDEDGASSNPLGEVLLQLTEDGKAVSNEGYFGAVALEEGAWVIDPESHGMEDMLVIQSTAENADGSFTYTAYLRPWGQTWEDAEQKPYYYNSWYLPLIEAGQPMPDRIPQD